MYAAKPMRGPNLMQAIARVNRVFTQAEMRLATVEFLDLARKSVRNAVRAEELDDSFAAIHLDRVQAIRERRERLESLER